ncbi:MAG: hypothetical protein FJ387_03065 [Verrucomicrobia bacterium]|nr:hypothetical protein [Verrucomicrobiota bacterium]
MMHSRYALRRHQPLVARHPLACHPHPPTGRAGRIAATALLILASTSSALLSQPIPIPNASFESPTTDFADPRIDSWQKTPKPFWYDESGGFLWAQLTGVFLNTPPSSPDHIANVDGKQAIFLFAVPEVGLFQDYESTDWTGAPPSHAFDVRFQVGRTYQLTVAVLGGGGNMAEGATLELSLYYRDDSGALQTVDATTVTHSLSTFPNLTRLVDFTLESAPVQATDPWAGRHLGVRLLSTVNPALAGGYWDLDQVRLTMSQAPKLLDPTWADGRLRFLIASEPGLRFEILTTSNVTQPMPAWTSLGTVTNLTGQVTFEDPAPAAPHRFYRAQQLP